MNYINSQSHLENLNKINGVHTVILNFRNLFYIDVDGLDSLKEIIETMREKGKKVIISSAGPFIIPVLDREDWFEKMKQESMVFNSTTEALKTLGFEIGKASREEEGIDLQTI